MIEQDEEKTKVIFRIFHDGDVIALFPELPGTGGWVGLISTCESYQHIGQHGAASVDLVYCTRLATEAEYKDLQSELQSIGYDLKIGKKITKFDTAKRIRSGDYYNE